MFRYAYEQRGFGEYKMADRYEDLKKAGAAVMKYRAADSPVFVEYIALVDYVALEKKYNSLKQKVVECCQENVARQWESGELLSRNAYLEEENRRLAAELNEARANSDSCDPEEVERLLETVSAFGTEIVSLTERNAELRTLYLNARADADAQYGERVIADEKCQKLRQKIEDMSDTISTIRSALS